MNIKRLVASSTGRPTGNINLKLQNVSTSLDVTPPDKCQLNGKCLCFNVTYELNKVYGDL